MMSPPLPQGTSLFRPIPRLVTPPSLPGRPVLPTPTPSRCSPSGVSCGAMAGEATGSAFRTVRTVTVSYSELKDKKLDLSAKIEEGFGPGGLGILSVSDVPEFNLLRQHLLQLSPRLASLPENAKGELEDPESRYPSYCRPNKWPTTSLPELEGAFKALGKLMLDVGLVLAQHCDQYESKDTTGHHGEALENILLHSRCHKGRLLYYFPRQKSECSEDNLTTSSWCGWHTDHGSLTGLTCGMFMRNGIEMPSPDCAAGLYVKTRDNEIVKVFFGEDEIAYQIGETTEILSRGRLCATPHCVKAPKGEMASGVERSTFALFMQPDWEQILRFPEEVHLHHELIPPSGTLTFGEYSEMLLNKYYSHRAT